MWRKAEAAHHALGEALQKALAAEEAKAPSPEAASDLQCLRAALAQFPSLRPPAD
jgi:hypothetical protein